MLSAWASKQSEDVQRRKEEKNSTDYSAGPVKYEERGCTDVIWIPIFILAQVVFVAVTIMGITDGNPQKLYEPRDFQGAYCNVEENWNGGPNTKGFDYLSYTMNTTSVVDQIFQQTVCSTAASKALTQGGSSGGSTYAPLLTTQALRDKYLCDCCLAPCQRCSEKTNNGGDLSSPTDVSSIISGRMAELTGSVGAGNLFNPSVSANGKLFSGNAFWEQATKYFNTVCLPDCNTNFAMMNTTTMTTRNYTYKPAQDDPLHDAWELLLTQSNGNSSNPFVDGISSA